MNICLRSRLLLFASSLVLITSYGFGEAQDDLSDIQDDNLRKAVEDKLEASRVSIASLKKLDASGLKILSLKGIDVAAGLEVLNLEGNRLDEVTPLADLVELKRLDLSGNRLVDIRAISDLKKLKVLDLGKNEIENLDALATLVFLEKIYLNHNKTTSLESVSLLPAIKELVLDHNRINDISQLLDNPRLGNGVVLDLRFNCLDLTSGSDSEHVLEQLAQRGVSVRAQPQKRADKCGLGQ